MSMNHTKGNWSYIDNGEVIIVDSNTEFGNIAELETSKECYQEQLANAKLMAAAPELLECVLDALSDLRGRMSVGMILAFQTAIKKATE